MSWHAHFLFYVETSQMTKVCYCADDFSMSPEISSAILDLIEKHRLHATSCMTQSHLWKSDAQRLMKFLEHIECGLHLNFTHFFDADTPSFSLPKLMFLAWSKQLDAAAIRQNIETQWNHFIEATGKTPDFVDGHQHVHQFPVIRDVLVEFLNQQRFDGWVRNLDHPLSISPYRLKTFMLRHLGAAQLNRSCQTHHIQQNRYFAGIYDFKFSNYAALNQQWLQKAQDGLLVMCHPSLLHSSIQDPIHSARVAEYQYLQSNQFEQDCHKFNIQRSKIGAILCN